MKEPKETFSMSLANAEEARQLLRGMVQDLSDRFPTMKRQDASQSHAEPTQAQAPAPATQNAVPLNAANLQQQQQQLNKMHQRSASRSGQTPAAPTSSQPPFLPFGGGSSPHGTPNYIGKSQLTQGDLHLPARKKARGNNNTPAQGQAPTTTASPQVKSPELKKQATGESKPQQKPSLSCPEPDCERHNTGFDSKEALDLHTQEEHIRPLQNPVKYAEENLAAVLGLDSQGRSKQPNHRITSEPAPATAVKMAANNSKQGQTPRTPAGVATPMNRQTSMNRQPSTAGSKGAPDSKVNPTKAQRIEKESNMQNPPAQVAPILDPWANTTIDPTELFQTFQGFDAGATGAISDGAIYRSNTPNDTPESSKDGVSEPNSDISEGVGLDINLSLFDESWQPFGGGDFGGFASDINDLNFGGPFGDDDMTMNLVDTDLAPFDIQPGWDDMIDFDKPFTFDTTEYSMVG
jgi:hypothetical protein